MRGTLLRDNSLSLHLDDIWHGMAYMNKKRSRGEFCYAHHMLSMSHYAHETFLFILSLHSIILIVWLGKISVEIINVTTLVSRQGGVNVGPRP